MAEVKPLITIDKERDAKFPAFERLDKDQFTWWKLPCKYQNL